MMSEPKLVGCREPLEGLGAGMKFTLESEKFLAEWMKKFTHGQLYRAEIDERTRSITLKKAEPDEAPSNIPLNTAEPPQFRSKVDADVIVEAHAVGYIPRKNETRAEIIAEIQRRKNAKKG